MKPNQDIVNLIAIQELADVVAPTISDYLNIGKADDLLGKRITVNDLAQLISSVLGSGSLLPERVYRIGTSLPSGATLSEDGTTIYDPYLDGKVYQLNRRGIELSIKGLEWDNGVINPDNDVLGGVRLLTEGDVFSEGETIILTFQPQFSPYIPTPDAIARFTSGEQLITADSTITSGMYRKLIVLQSSSNTLSVTLPSATDYPENVILAIISNGGSHKQATLICDGSDVIYYDNTEWAEFWLGYNEQILLIPTAGGWRVVYFSGSEHFGRLGVTDLGALAGPNHWVATSDMPQLRSVYPRVWNFIQRLQAAQPAAVVSGASWVTNKGLWGTGDGSTTFNFPNKSGRFPRYLDPSGELDEDRFSNGTASLPGSLEDQQLLNHVHNANRPKKSGRITSAGTDWTDVENAPTSEPVGDALGYVGAENRPWNIGELPLINI